MPRDRQSADDVEAGEQHEIATEPVSFPAMSSNGVTDPISTSLIRLIFSSITLLRSCGAPDITEKSTIIIVANGIANVRTLSTGGAALIAPLASRSSSPSSDTSTRCVSRLTSARSRAASRKRRLTISRLIVAEIQPGNWR